MKNLNEMNKAELRAACKEAGVKNYGNMTTQQMREAVAATQAPVVSEEDQALIDHCGHATCPHCQTTLSNGYWEADALVRTHLHDGNKKEAVHFNQQATNKFWCMACDMFFGEARVPMNLNPAKRDVAMGTGIKIEKNREERNGIKRPSIGGVCREVWDWCDAFKARTSEDPKPTVIKEVAVVNNWNLNNAVIELYRWKKFVA